MLNIYFCLMFVEMEHEILVGKMSGGAFRQSYPGLIVLRPQLNVKKVC